MHLKLLIVWGKINQNVKGSIRYKPFLMWDIYVKQKVHLNLVFHLFSPLSQHL